MAKYGEAPLLLFRLLQIPQIFPEKHDTLLLPLLRWEGRCMKKTYLFCVSLLLAFFLCPIRAAEAPVTRSDFLLLLWEDRGAVPYDITAHPFTDLSGRDAEAQAAAWAWANGLANGVGGDLFAPDRPLTREECAAFLRRYDAFLGRDIFLPLGPSLCNDYEDISPWAQDDLYWACITGRMDWLENRLAPLSPVTRKEAEEYFTALSH